MVLTTTSSQGWSSHGELSYFQTNARLHLVPDGVQRKVSMAEERSSWKELRLPLDSILVANHRIAFLESGNLQGSTKIYPFPIQ
jgi:hypothetical protein